MVEFFQPLTKTSGMVLKFDPYGALMINRGNRISIVFHLYCCSMHKLSTIPLANVASLSLFFMLAIWFKKLFKFFFLYFISLYHLRLDYHYGIQQAWICLTPLTKICHMTPLPPHDGHLSTTGHFLLSPRWPFWRGSTVYRVKDLDDDSLIILGWVMEILYNSFNPL